MTEKDETIRSLLEENARLRAQLMKAKAMQFKLFMMVPPEGIAELLKEYLEHYNDDETVPAAVAQTTN